MKQLAAAICAIFLLTLTVSAADSQSVAGVDINAVMERLGIDTLLKEAPEPAQKLLRENGLEGLEIGAVLQLSPSKLSAMALQYVKEKLSRIKGTTYAMVGIIILCALLDAFRGGNMENTMAPVFSLAATLCVTAAVSLPVTDCIGQSAAAIQESTAFMLSYIPVYAAVIASAGMPMTAAAYSMALLGACQFVGQFASGVLVPLLGVYLSLYLVGAITANEGIKRIGGAIRSFTTWMLSFLMTVFVGLLTIQSLISSSSDTLGLKTAKFLIGSFVPVVGSALSDALVAAQGCMHLIKNTVGALGVLVTVFTFLPSLIGTSVWYLIFSVVTAIGEMMGVKQIVGVLKAFNDMLSVLLAMILCTALLLIVSTGVVLTLGGK